MKSSFFKDNDSIKKSTGGIDFDRAATLTAYALVIICGAIFISLTFNNNVWLDEAFTASLVNTDMAAVLI